MTQMTASGCRSHFAYLDSSKCLGSWLPPSQPQGSLSQWLMGNMKAQLLLGETILCTSQLPMGLGWGWDFIWILPLLILFPFLVLLSALPYCYLPGTFKLLAHKSLSQGLLRILTQRKQLMHLVVLFSLYLRHQIILVRLVIPSDHLQTPINSYLGLRQKQGFEEEMKKITVRNKKLGPHYQSLILRHEVGLRSPMLSQATFYVRISDLLLQQLMGRDGRCHSARWFAVVPGRWCQQALVGMVALNESSRRARQRADTLPAQQCTVDVAQVPRWGRDAWWADIS